VHLDGVGAAVTRRSIAVPGLEHGGNPIPNACAVGNMVFSSAVYGIDRTTGELAEGIEAQTTCMFANVDEILRLAAAAPEHVGQMAVSLSSTDDRAILNAAWVEMFPNPASRPARHVTIAPLPSGALVQCQFIAVVSGPE
jgi:enamine deaminase RidA (YjgF/YER057c/UK114 family)